MGIQFQLKVLQYIYSTRWNAIYYMLEHFVQLKISIQGTMGLVDNAPPCLNSEH